MTTDQREQEMARLKRVAEIMAQLDSDPLNARVADMLDRYPRMPRERALRLVAAQIESKR